MIGINFKAKTGTMRNLSSLAGIFKTRNNTDIVFVTIAQDSNKKKALFGAAKRT